MSAKKVRHTKINGPSEYKGRQGIECSCNYVHPVNGNGQMDTTHVINEIGDVVSVSKPEYLIICDRDEWMPYDCF